MKKLQKQNLTDHRPNEATDQDYVIVPIQGPIVLKTVKKQDFTGKQILSFEIVDQYKKEGTTFYEMKVKTSVLNVSPAENPETKRLKDESAGADATAQKHSKDSSSLASKNKQFEWNVHHRFSDFHELHKQLIEHFKKPQFIPGSFTTPLAPPSKSKSKSGGTQGNQSVFEMPKFQTKALAAMQGVFKTNARVEFIVKYMNSLVTDKENSQLRLLLDNHEFLVFLDILSTGNTGRTDWFGIPKVQTVQHADDLTGMQNRQIRTSQSVTDFTTEFEFKDNLERIAFLLKNIEEYHNGASGQLNVTSIFKKFEYLTIKYNENDVKRLFNGNGVDQKGLVYYLQDKTGDYSLRKEILLLLENFFNVLKNENFNLFQKIFAKQQPEKLQKYDLGSYLSKQAAHHCVISIIDCYLQGRAKEGKNKARDLKEIFPTEDDYIRFETLYNDWHGKKEQRGRQIGKLRSTITSDNGSSHGKPPKQYSAKSLLGSGSVKSAKLKGSNCSLGFRPQKSSFLFTSDLRNNMNTSMKEEDEFNYVKSARLRPSGTLSSSDDSSSGRENSVFENPIDEIRIEDSPEGQTRRFQTEKVCLTDRSYPKSKSPTKQRYSRRVLIPQELFIKPQNTYNTPIKTTEADGEILPADDVAGFKKEVHAYEVLGDQDQFGQQKPTEAENQIGSGLNTRERIVSEHFESQEVSDDQERKPMSDSQRETTGHMHAEQDSQAAMFGSEHDHDNVVNGSPADNVSDLMQQMVHQELDQKVMEWIRDYQRRRKVHKVKDQLYLEPELFTLNTIFSLELQEKKRKVKSTTSHSSQDSDSRQEFFSLKTLQDFIDANLKEDGKEGEQNDITDFFGFDVVLKNDISRNHKVIEIQTLGKNQDLSCEKKSPQQTWYRFPGQPGGKRHAPKFGPQPPNLKKYCFLLSYTQMDKQGHVSLFNFNEEDRSLNSDTVFILTQDFSPRDILNTVTERPQEEDKESLSYQGNLLSAFAAQKSKEAKEVEHRDLYSEALPEEHRDLIDTSNCQAQQAQTEERTQESSAQASQYLAPPQTLPIFGNYATAGKAKRNTPTGGPTKSFSKTSKSNATTTCHSSNKSSNASLRSQQHQNGQSWHPTSGNVQITMSVKRSKNILKNFTSSIKNVCTKLYKAA